MTPLNYLNLSAGVGFFVGLIFGILQSDSAEILVFWTIGFSVVFYLLGLFFVGLFLRSTPPQLVDFDKEKISQNLDQINAKFNIKESEFKAIKSDIEIFNFNLDDKYAKKSI